MKGMILMAAKMQRYFSSKKFRKDMKKVGPNTPPYGHSTPTEELLERLAASVRKTSTRPSKYHG
jgi:hypothetical protein